jgi:hypothetical protein
MKADVKRFRSFSDLDAEAEVCRALGLLEERIQRQFPDVVALITVIRTDLFALRISSSFCPSGYRPENYVVFTLHASWTESGVRLDAWLESQEGSRSETFDELEGVDVEEARPDAGGVCRQWMERLTSELVSIGDRVVVEVGRLRALEAGRIQRARRGRAYDRLPSPIMTETSSVDAAYIDAAIAELAYDDGKARRLAGSEAAGVRAEIASRFAMGRPRSLGMDLREPHTSRRYERSEWRACLENALGELGSSRGWLVVDGGTEGDVLYQVDLGAVAELLANAPFLEYAIVDESVSVILADTDHNEILVAWATSGLGHPASRGAGGPEPVTLVIAGDLSLSQFVHTCRLGALFAGMEMAAVRELLGEPCDVGTLGDGDIDKYGEGRLQVYYAEKRVVLIAVYQRTGSDDLGRLTLVRDLAAELVGSIDRFCEWLAARGVAFARTDRLSGTSVRVAGGAVAYFADGVLDSVQSS